MRIPKANDTTFIRTFTGGFFWPLDPRADEIKITDIAHSLANSCRWTGHVKSFYSVAQHSVIVSKTVNPEYALQGLLHDASEAYLVDLSRPIKHAKGLGEIYRKVERKLEMVIFKHFGLPSEIHPSIKVVDDMLLWTEKRDLMAGDWDEKLAGQKKTLSEKIVPWSPEDAERRFLARFGELTGTQHEKIHSTPALRASSLLTSVPLPLRPPNSFTHSEYMEENGVSRTGATRMIKSLFDAGRIVPVRIKIEQRDGKRVVVGGWQLRETPDVGPVLTFNALSGNNSTKEVHPPYRIDFHEKIR